MQVPEIFAISGASSFWVSRGAGLGDRGPSAAGRCVGGHSSSGTCSLEVNDAMHGSPGSQHTLGEAADIWADGLTGEELAMVIHQLGLPFDQVIWYAPERGGHVHVSFTERRPNRSQVLYAPATGGYLAWSFSRA